MHTPSAEVDFPGHSLFRCFHIVGSRPDAICYREPLDTILGVFFFYPALLDRHLGSLSCERAHRHSIC
jgi:hypothetical protein